MIRRERLRLLVGLVLTLAIVVPLGWMWWGSRIPASYSAMDMGEHDLGDGHGMRSGVHAGTHTVGAASVSVADLDTATDRRADVVVELTARQGPVRLASGRTVDGFSFNGTSPGPGIEATVGDLVEVRLHNESVVDGVALHWHGVDVPNAQDGVAGVTQDAVAVGGDHVYRWVAPDAGTYWYHSHQLSHEQVAKGLFGSILIHPERRDRDVRDVVAQAHLYGSVQTLDGAVGDVPVEAVAGERVRVRLVNTDNGPQSAWTGAPFRVLAVDGVDVTAPPEVRDRLVRIPGGGRMDLAVQVPSDGAAVRVQLLGGVALVIGPAGSTAAEVARPTDAVDLLGYGEPGSAPFDASRADRSFDYAIGRRPGFHDGRPGVWWTVNGRLHPDMPTFVVREGDVVRVRISNDSGDVHPMHLHGHHALVLARDGRQATGSPWWFDSLDVQDGETYDVAFVADNPGIWMDHCHNLTHAKEGLVTHLVYEGVTTPYLIGDDTGNVPE